MRERVTALLAEVRDVVGALDEHTLRSDDAVELASDFAEIKKLAGAACAILGKRVEQTGIWRAEGATSAAAWLAQRTGSTASATGEVLHAMETMESNAELREAFVGGRLSEKQAVEIAAAVNEDPAALSGLLRLAEDQSVFRLTQACKGVRMAALGGDPSLEDLRRMRYFRHWNDRAGLIHVDALLAAEDAAPVLLKVEQRQRALQAETRAAGIVERAEALAADAFCSLFADDAKVDVNVVVSGSALERGHTVAGETCRIDGFAPITVAAAKRLAMRGSVKVVETNGSDVRRIAHLGRLIDAKLRTALEVRDRTCVVPGCGRRHGLEIDHLVPLSEGGRTELENLARMCHFHHVQKTHHGWRLSGHPGSWKWERKPYIPRVDRADVHPTEESPARSEHPP